MGPCATPPERLTRLRERAEAGDEHAREFLTENPDWQQFLASARADQARGNKPAVSHNDVLYDTGTKRIVRLGHAA